MKIYRKTMFKCEFHATESMVYGAKAQIAHRQKWAKDMKIQRKSMTIDPMQSLLPKAPKLLKKKAFQKYVISN